MDQGRDTFKTIKFSTEDVHHPTLLTFKRWKNPGNAEGAKRPHNCQRLMTVRPWWGKMKKAKLRIQGTVRACNETSQETIEHLNNMRVGVGVSFLVLRVCVLVA